MSAPRAILGRHRGFEKLTILAFALALVAPSVDGFLRDGTPSVLVENRRAAPAPTLARDLGEWRLVPERLEAFLKDRIGFRHALIRLHNVVELLGLGRSPVASMLAGRDGWLFYTGDQTFETGRGILPLSDAQLERWRCTLEARRNWLAARGVPYLFVIAPDKSSVYPDLLPEGSQPIGPSRYDQLAAHLAAHSDVMFLDLRPALAAARVDRHVYFPHGSHWNAIGAHVAYRTVRAAISRWFPDVAAAARPDPEFDRVDETGESWAAALHLEGLLHQPVYAVLDPAAPRWQELPPKLGLRTTAIQGSTLPKALVYYDSFGLPWIPKLSEDFSEVVYIRERDMNFSMVAGAQPDIVIHEMVERFLIHLPDDQGTRGPATTPWTGRADPPPRTTTLATCLLYTSDAADE